MKFGFQSAILDGLSFEEVIDFAAEQKFECVEIMCWPKGKAERKYAGVTHLDVADFTEEDAARVQAYCAAKGVEISALGYYPNPLTPDRDEAAVYIAHIKKVIDASVLLGLHLVTTFVGNDWTKSVDENWPRFKEVWGDILSYAEERKVRIGIENCAMFFTGDEWPAGKNLAYSPAIWRRMFEAFNTPYFGLNYDPSHFVWMQMDYMKPLGEFMPRFFHAHAKDVKLDRARLDDVGTMATPLSYHDPRIPGRGDIDWGMYVAGLKAAGYDGAFCIEVEDSDYEGSLEDRKRALVESAAHLRQFL
ncbi:sugar phosphate isomerase/epimerase family protein [Kordiimonas sp.]|uniref:sugar phosphate isomerase/epimerase family protein n=1 Tax=Kordiimonas sp. TaxID=1970157 RepID=UPI003A93F2E0